jgi:hypothetical protein
VAPSVAQYGVRVPFRLRRSSKNSPAIRPPLSTSSTSNRTVVRQFRPDALNIARTCSRVPCLRVPTSSGARTREMWNQFCWHVSLEGRVSWRHRLRGPALPIEIEELPVSLTFHFTSQRRPTSRARRSPYPVGDGHNHTSTNHCEKDDAGHPKPTRADDFIDGSIIHSSGSLIRSRLTVPAHLRRRARSARGERRRATREARDDSNRGDAQDATPVHHRLHVKNARAAPSGAAGC